MLPTIRPTRRRRRCIPKLCAIIAAVLLLLSVSLLHTRLSQPTTSQRTTQTLQNDDVTTLSYSSETNPLLSDSNDDVNANVDFDFDDKIDVQDVVDNDPFDDPNSIADPEDWVKADEIERSGVKGNGFYFDHFGGSVRRRLNRRSIDELGDDDDVLGFGLVGLGSGDDPSKSAFGSDDVSASEYVRKKVSEVVGVEDALLLKSAGSKLREGWGNWFDKKGDFLRRDRMFKSNLEALNPLNNPLLQDPDGVGVTGLSRGDKLVQKWLLSEFKKAPFLNKKVLGLDLGGVGRKGDGVGDDGGKVEGKRGERRTLDDNARDFIVKKASDAGEYTVSRGSGSNDAGESSNSGGQGSLLNEIREIEGKNIEKVEGSGDLGRYNEFSGHIYADGSRWGYYPSLNPWLSYSDFMDAFFKEGNCSMRAFMVWNSPSWMYGVRHQRGLESLVSHHPDACVVVFSETVELDFFNDSFVKNGYRVAVAMPNLDELLEDTPTHIFASAWLEWRKTKYYSTHYSELVRLAALYKYGGIYLDSDVVVLKSLSWLDKTVGMEDQLTGSSLNGAVLAFGKHSPFIAECLKEFYMTYDDAKLRWNGADLMTRVATRFQSRESELKVQPSFVFFPVSQRNITRFFTAPVTETEKAQQEALFLKILNRSSTFHFWNSLTSSIIPEADSLVTRILEQHCIHCSDVL